MTIAPTVTAGGRQTFERSMTPDFRDDDVIARIHDGPTVAIQAAAKLAEAGT